MKNLKGKATQKQKDALDRLGLSYKKDITKQEASDLIGKEIERKQRPRQMDDHDYEFLEDELGGLTFGDTC